MAEVVWVRVMERGRARMRAQWSEVRVGVRMRVKVSEDESGVKVRVKMRVE